jgi:hypothetical protein
VAQNVTSVWDFGVFNNIPKTESVFRLSRFFLNGTARIGRFFSVSKIFHLNKETSSFRNTGA